jgi:5-methylcytosine-specific restriction enzyme A
MPQAAPRPCTHPGCGALTKSGRCDAHRYVRQRSHRGREHQKLYGYRWRQASKAFLSQHPLCQCDDCKEGELRITPSDVVDHHEPHRGDFELFWDQGNWRAMAKACHDRKTALEDGGFGNERVGATGKL